MNGQQYFEENPWNRACTLIAQQDLGPVHQVIAQCVCPAGTLQAAVEQWKERIAALAGPEKEGELLDAGRALSYIGTFGENTLVRMFFDDAAEDVCENFEIVTGKALLVWKPINTNQGHIYSADGCCIQSSQQYVVDLGGI